MTSMAPCEKRVLVVEWSFVEFYRVEIKTGQEGQQAFMHAPWHSSTRCVVLFVFEAHWRGRSRARPETWPTASNS